MGRSLDHLAQARRLEAEAAHMSVTENRRELLDLAQQWRDLARQSAEAEDQERGRRPPEERSFDA